MIKTAPTRYNPEFAFYANDQVIGRSIELYNEYSQIEIDFLLSLVGKDTVVYDIGGNIGYHAAAFASRAKHVYSFEPNPHNFNLLQRNTNHCNNVTAINCAVGSCSNLVRINDYDPAIPGNFGAVSITNSRSGVVVPCLSLNDVDNELPDLIKIDVEGYEYEVLLGCKGMIARKRPVIYYEAHETKQFAEIYNFLYQFGYKFYWAEIANFNQKNLAGNSINVFSNTGCFSVVAWPDCFQPLAMQEVAGPNDSHTRLEARPIS